MYELQIEEEKKKEKLKKFPKGFPYNDGGTYTCPVCGTRMKDETVWYDKCGQKCINCQHNLNKKVIPQSVLKKRDSWYALWELESKFGIKHMRAKKMVREGILKARILKNKSGQEYMYLFLKKENPTLAKT